MAASPCAASPATRGFPVASPVRKAVRGNQTKITGVKRALVDAELECAVPMGVRKMLALGADSVFHFYQADRVPFQAGVASQINAVFEEIQETKRRRIDESKSEEATARADLPAKEAEQKAADEEAEKAEAIATVEMDATKTFSEAEKEAAKQLREEQVADKAQEKEDAKVEKEVERVRKFQADLFAPLSERSGDEKHLKKLVAELEKNYAAESPLLAVIPVVYSKAPEERVAFDLDVAQAAEGLVEAKLGSLAGRRAEIAAERGRLEPGIREKAQAHEKAVAEHQEQKARLSAARDEASVRRDAASAAREAAEQCNTVISEFASALAIKEHDLDIFGNTCAALAELVSLAPAPTPSPVKEASADVAGSPAASSPAPVAE